MQNLIKEISTYAEIGIHPSYNSGNDADLTRKEILRLENITKKKTKYSRQHFLRFQLPHTFRGLVKAEIEKDFSMGYADISGFRSGTATPYPFFDLDAQKTLPLQIVPLHAMDGTLRDYMNLTPEVALEKLKNLIDKVKAVKGTFTTLWHNDVLADTPNNRWRWVYLEMAQYISEIR